MTRNGQAVRAAAFDESLDLAFAMRGETPGTGTKLVRPPFRVPDVARAELGGVVIAAGPRLEELEDAARLRGPLPLAMEEEIAEGRLMRELLRYRPGTPVDSLEQLLVVFAALVACEEPPLPVQRAGDFIEAFLAGVRAHDTARLSAVRAAASITEEDLRVFRASAKEALAPVVPGR